MNKKILVVEDDSVTKKILVSILEKHGFITAGAETGADALSYLQDHRVSGVMLDLVLPDMSGLEILKFIRSHPLHSPVAVLIVTGNDDKLDAILGLEMGADDYITKPFHQRELIARLNAVLRRSEPMMNECGALYTFDGLEIDIEKRLVKKDGSFVNLSFKEFEVLALLVSNAGRVISRQEIMDRIGGEDYSPDSRTVDMHISSIRRKIGDTGEIKRYIDTVSGVGYRFRE